VNPALPPLREVIARHGLAAKHALGQHFLLDASLTARIAQAAGPLAAGTTIEIGPGPGGLTRALLEAGAAHVLAIEIDQRCLPALAELSDAFPGRLTVVRADALACDPIAEAQRHGLPAPFRIAANLPYNIATPLLLGWLRDVRRFERFTLMFQKEVADRLTAAPGGKSYGRLTVLTQWLCAVRRLFVVPPGAFVPRPKVDSAVVELLPRAVPLAPAERADLERVTAAAFGQRRKMLRAALRSLAIDAAALLEAAGIAPTERAEQLSVEQFCALACAYAALRGAASGRSSG
jgi:16S rRNA (adenine1518-N6/adenine1519-N6)-dimethyltransferase